MTSCQRHNVGFNMDDINECTAYIIAKLTGITNKQAYSIVKYRQLVGHIGSVDELANIDGFRKLTINKIKKRLEVNLKNVKNDAVLTASKCKAKISELPEKTTTLKKLPFLTKPASKSSERPLQIFSPISVEESPSGTRLIATYQLNVKNHTPASEKRLNSKTVSGKYNNVCAKYLNATQHVLEPTIRSKRGVTAVRLNTIPPVTSLDKIQHVESWLESITTESEEDKNVNQSKTKSAVRKSKTNYSNRKARSPIPGTSKPYNTRDNVHDDNRPTLQHLKDSLGLQSVKGLKTTDKRKNTSGEESVASSNISRRKISANSRRKQRTPSVKSGSQKTFVSDSDARRRGRSKGCIAKQVKQSNDKLHKRHDKSPSEGKKDHGDIRRKGKHETKESDRTDKHHSRRHRRKSRHGDKGKGWESQTLEGGNRSQSPDKRHNRSRHRNKTGNHVRSDESMSRERKKKIDDHEAQGSKSPSEEKRHDHPRSKRHRQKDRSRHGSVRGDESQLEDMGDKDQPEVQQDDESSDENVDEETCVDSHSDNRDTEKRRRKHHTKKHRRERLDEEKEDEKGHSRKNHHREMKHRKEGSGEKKRGRKGSISSSQQRRSKKESTENASCLVM